MLINSFTYDSYGNPLTSKVGGSTLYINSSATYTAGGNYTKTVTDASGNTVTYNTDETKGNITSVADPKGNTTNYTYEANTDNLTSVFKTVGDKNITNSYSYVNDRLDTITHNGFSYNFDYDKLGNNTAVNVGTQNLITNFYEARSSKLLISTYGNGNYINYDYDNIDRIIAKKVNDVTKFTYEYNASGNLGYVNDIENGVKYRYIYDLADRQVLVTGTDGSSYSFGYDANNNNSKIDETVGASTFFTSFTYDKDNKLKEVLFGGDKKSTNTYDAIGRLTEKSIYTGSTTYNTTIGYKAGVYGSSTVQVESISNNGNGISYTYDANGNIETITENGKVIKYTYDELNEVTREDNQVLNKTITYSYDAGGNIVSKTEYPYTTGELGTATKTYNYSYGDSNWKDKLTNYDGKEITYDAIGNPLEDGIYKYTWEAGRQLKGISGNGKTISYKYNDSGIRTQKTVNGVTTKYYLSGNKVTYESNGTDNIHYTYDSSDNLISMNILTKNADSSWTNPTEFYYIRNAQSDIIGLIDENGSQVVSYSYDTWGKLLLIDGTLKDTVGKKNPYRYRGYRYDTETGLYYLQSRYYNPEWGRFINADALGGQVGSLLSHNIFAYCQNNVVNMSDPSGFVMICMAEGGSGGSSVAPKTNGMMYSTIINSTLACGDKISENIVNATIKTGKTLKTLDGSEMGFGPGFTLQSYVEKNSLGAFTKNVGKVAGLISVAYCGITVGNDLRRGEVFSAVIDIASFAAGIGVGIGMSFVAGLLITASTPALVAGAIGVGAIAASVAIGIGIDYVADIAKNYYYER